MLTRIHRWVQIALALIMLVTASIATPVRANASVLYVKWNAGGANNGTSWANAYTDLQSALAASSSGDQIWVAAGTYKPADTERQISFVLKDGVKLYGGFAGTESLLSQRNLLANISILSGDIGTVENGTDNSYHVVIAALVGNTTVLDGFAIVYGRADGVNEPDDRGAGLLNSDGRPVLANLLFRYNNSSTYGGGIYNLRGNPSLRNIRFWDNNAYLQGAGMYNMDHSSPTLVNVDFRNNLVYGPDGSGGGMANVLNSSPLLTNVSFGWNQANASGGGMSNLQASAPTLSGVIFTGNAAFSGDGAGLYNSDSNPILDSVTFSGNWAYSQSGGGIANVNSNSVLTNVTFVNNHAYSGAGMVNKNSSPVIINATFSGNMAEANGGGITNNSSTPFLTNVILWGDTADSDPEIYSISSAVTVSHSIVQGGHDGTGNLNADPLLNTLANNGGYTATMSLQPGSPAIDSGDDANCPPTDPRGIKRPQWEHCDIGAYEFLTGGILPTTPTFADVPKTHKYWPDIEILYANNMTGGCTTSPLKFCPDQIMNRGQAAVFILRANLGSSYVPPAAVHIFQDDWSKGVWAEPWAEGMRNEGLSGGCLSNPLKYCPWDQIPREQAVIFALRMKYGKDYIPPPATGTMFADMTNVGYYATPWAEQAYKDEIILDCGSSGGKPKFCPNALVSRGLAAYMIVRAKSLTMP